MSPMNSADAQESLMELADNVLNLPNADDSSPNFIFDGVSIAMHDAVPDKQRFLDFYWHVADAAKTAAFGSLINSGWLTYDQAIPYIEKYQGFLESEIAVLARTHSISYWLMLCHRIRPDADGIGVNAWTEQGARRVMDAAILKYGSFGSGNELPIDIIDKNGSLWPEPVDEDSVFNAYRLEGLALELEFSTAALRRLVKNGLLQVAADRSSSRLILTNEKEDCRLIDQYDKRCTLFDHSGTSSGLVTPQQALDRDDSDRPFEIYLPYINAHGHIIPMLWFDGHNQPHEIPFTLDGSAPAPSNYIVGPFDMAPHAQFLIDVDARIGQASPQDVVSLLVTMCRHKFEKALYSLPLMRELHQRGYVHTDVDAMFQVLLPKCWKYRQRVFKENLSASTCRKGMAAAYRALCLDPEKRNSMSVVHSSPCPIFVPVSRNTVVVNYWSIPYWIEELTMETARTAGKSGTIRGNLLEKTILSRMRDDLPDCRLWKKAHEVLKMTDGSKMEIDASYVRGNLLIVLEDKNAVHSERFERGVPDAPIQEFSTFDKDLVKLRRNAAKLLLNRSGHNYRLSDDVTTVLPVIITNEVKYIAVDRPDLFLDADTPVVCTIDELVEFLSRTDNDTIARLPCVVPKH